MGGYVTETIRREPVAQTLEENYMPYVMSVILSRAIPEIDGLKPAHRKLLYTMYKMGLLKGNKTKSANVVGQTMRLNPHGDGPIYATMVRMSRGNESLLYPYIDSKGNFGKVYSRDMQYAASRYTEVKLEEFCELLFADVDKGTVEFVPNYDGTDYEPLLLPVKVPTILINPNRGIAVGMASNIASFHLEDVINATVALLKSSKANLQNIIKGPDFPTGGYCVEDPQVMEQVIEKGTGTFRLRAKAQIIPKENRIEITEIPYGTTVEAIMDRIIAGVKEGSYKEISDVRDESDLKGLRLTIDAKRGTDLELLLAKLYRDTPMEDTFSCNFNVLINAYPKQLGIRHLLLHWLDFRMDCVRGRLRYDINLDEKKLHLIRGLEQLLLDIDRVIALIRATPKEKDVVPSLMREFLLDEEQAEYVANIRLRNINKEFITSRVSERQALEDKIASNKLLYGSDKRIKKYIEEELKEILKKYRKPRKTVLIEPIEELIEEEEEMTTESQILLLTRENYLKKIPQSQYDPNQEQRLKDGDDVRYELEVNEWGDLLIFTTAHRVFKLRVADIESVRHTELGLFVPHELEMEDGEETVLALATNDYSGYVLFAFERGKVAKIPLSSYATKTNRRMLVRAYDDSQQLVRALALDKEAPLLFSRYERQKENWLLIDSSLIPEKTTRHSQGVNVMRIGKTGRLTDMEPASSSANLEKFRSKTIPSAGKVRRPFE
jgi:DNA gyrase subunit A